MTKLRVLAVVALVLGPGLAPRSVAAAEPALVIADGATERGFTATELLARPDSAAVTVQDSASAHPATYRAVPLLALLGGALNNSQFDTLEARASDGFVTQIPLALVARGAKGGAVPFVAVEDPAHPWPNLPNQTVSAGPFYLVWEHPERSGVTSEQWPYELVRLSFVESPVHRWPQLAAPPGLPADAPARRGQEVFLAQCLPCHRMNGGGAAEMGPDLGRPMNPTQYLSEAGLRALIRNPAAVRTWPDRRMVGFKEADLSDPDLEAVVAYLHAMAGKSGTGAAQ